MLCNQCGAESRVLETRLNKKQFACIRKRQCEHCGHKFSTVETYTSSFHVDTNKLSAFAAAAKKRIALRARDIDIATNLHLGWKLFVEKYNLTKSAVYYAAKSGRTHIRKIKK